MATSTSTARKPRTTKTATARKPRATKTAATRKPRASAATTRRSSTPAQPRTVAGQAQALAQRAVHVQVGASLLARENLIGTIRDVRGRYGTRAKLERELVRCERRGVRARKGLERQARGARTRLERAGRDVSRQPGVIGARVEKLVSDAQHRLTAL
ncbi:MAG: hypothetical protein ACRDMX_07935 [Solirubrobacteraceae bacterium]